MRKRASAAVIGLAIAGVSMFATSSAGGDLMVTEDGVLVSQPGPMVAPLALYELRDGACAPHGAAR